MDIINKAIFYFVYYRLKIKMGFTTDLWWFQKEKYTIGQKTPIEYYKHNWNCRLKYKREKLREEYRWGKKYYTNRLFYKIKDWLTPPEKLGYTVKDYKPLLYKYSYRFWKRNKNRKWKKYLKHLKK